MCDLHDSAVNHARKMLRDVFVNGGAILFREEAVKAGLVQDVKPGEWYRLERDEDGNFMFIDREGERNYAGAPLSSVFMRLPTATLTCPF